MISDVSADPPRSPTACVLCCSASRASCARRPRPSASTSRQVTLLWLVRERPGLSLRELAAEERISAPALSGHVDRLERAGLIERVRSARRPPPRRPRAHPRRRELLKRVRARRTTWLAERLRARADELAAIEAALEPLRRAARDRGAPRSQRAHVRAACAATELPPLLHRPGHLGERHVDAEHRARLARGRADRARRSRSARSRSAASRRSRSSGSSPASSRTGSTTAGS